MAAKVIVIMLGAASSGYALWYSAICRRENRRSAAFVVAAIALVSLGAIVCVCLKY